MAGRSGLRSLPASQFGLAQAEHLLQRAGFGGTRDQVRAIRNMGLHQAVAYLVDYDKIDITQLPQPQTDPDVMHPPTLEERKLIRQSRRSKDPQTRAAIRREIQKRRVKDRQMLRELVQWWIGQMVRTPRPLQEKLTLLWHGHFASRHRNVRDTYLMQQQNQMFRRYANDSFATLAHQIVRDPAMLRFLNNDSNRKQKPNENLARELMELFTLGEGHYHEQDIKQGAKALTGYALRDNDFQFHKWAHDNSIKTILGKTGNFNGDDFVDILLERKDCARFVAYKLYKHFVADLESPPPEVTPDAPPDAPPKIPPKIARKVAAPVGTRTAGHAALQRHASHMIDALANLLRQHDYQLKPVLTALLTSQAFYDPAIIGQKIKSPVQLLIGTLRMLQTPMRDMALLADAMTMMGQTLLDPPSVAGWDGGRSWINTSTFYTRQNTTAYLITGKLPFEDDWSTDKIDYDPLFLLEGLTRKTPEAVVNHLLRALSVTPVAKTRQQVLVRFVEKNSIKIKSGTILGLLLLITAMPEYQMC